MATRLLHEADGRRRAGALTEAEILLTAAFEASDDVAVSADALHEMAVVLRRRGRYADAEEKARQAIELLEGGGSSFHLGRSLVFLATLLVGDARDEEAFALVERALPLYEDELGSDHTEVEVVIAIALRLSKGLGREASARYYERRLRGFSAEA